MPRPDCSPLAALITEIAMDLSAREGIQTLDDIVMEIQKDFPIIDRQSVIDNILEATAQEKREATEAQKKWQAIRREVKAEPALKAHIEAINEYLRTGTLPEKAVRPPRGEGVIDSMRNVRDALKKRLNQSEPAVRQRLEQQIADLDALAESIREGTYQPPVKEAKPAMSDELEDLKFKRDEKRRQIQQTLNSAKPMGLWQKWNPFDFARDLITTGEFSFIKRQAGAVLYGRTGQVLESVVAGKPTIEPMRQTGRELKVVLRSLLSEKETWRMYQQMLEDPRMRILKRNGLHVSPVGVDAKMSEREEFALSRLAFEAPIIKQFSRAGALYLDFVRLNSAGAMIETMAIDGQVTTAEAKVIANFANIATGRGAEGSAAADQVRRVFFSYQYLVSRFKMLVGSPIFKHWDLDARRARILIAREFAHIAEGLALYYALLWLAGADIEIDPRSSDFMKARFGRTRIDPLMGIQQIVVFGARMVTGEKKNVNTGAVIALRGPGVEYGKTDALDTITNFVRSKLHPWVGFLINRATGKNAIGQPTTVAKDAWDMVHPMTWEDIYHAMEEDGIAKDAALSILTFLGDGMQTIQPEENPNTASTSRRRK